MIFDLLGTFLEPPGKWSPGARDGALELLATIFKEFLYFRPPGNIFGNSWKMEPWSSRWSPGTPGDHFLRNSYIDFLGIFLEAPGALELEMEPRSSKWSPGSRNGALDLELEPWTSE